MRPRKQFLAIAALIALASGAPCWAQFHIEVNYAKPNPANDREWLFGDWNGARTKLADKGVNFDFESTTDAMGVVHGGLSNQPAAWTRIRGTFDINFDKLTGKKLGLRLHATALWQTGVNIGAQLGTYANPSSIGSVHVFRMIRAGRVAW